MLTERQIDDIKFIKEARGLTVREDLIHHRLSLLDPHVYKRVNETELQRIKDWIINLKSILKQPDFHELDKQTA